MTADRIRRFGVLDRLSHIFLMLTFIVQTITGFSRLYITTSWGQSISNVFGGYETSLEVHKWVGIFMIIGFILHTVYLLFRVNWKDFYGSLFGPDSLLPNLQDVRNFKQQVLWFFGIGPAPRFDRWTYFEKFDYWAVYWGMPLLALTGLMMMYPLTTSRIVPGWFLNIALLLHRAEAILAVSYIFIVHFFIGHLRPTSFPLNEAMFAGSIPGEHARKEKPRWVERLTKEGRYGAGYAHKPVIWFRIAYFCFGYAILITGVYLLLNGIIYSRSIALH